MNGDLQGYYIKKKAIKNYIIFLISYQSKFIEMENTESSSLTGSLRIFGKKYESQK